MPAYNPGRTMEHCLSALARQRGVEDLRIEVLVVDNGSNPPLALGNATVIRHELPGSYAARNAGIRASSGEILAFTDADCEPTETWIAEGAKAIRAVGAPEAIVAGRVVLLASPSPTAAERFEQRYAFQQKGNLAEGFGVTANLFVTRSTFATVGFFDEALRSGGDREFGLRARSLGVVTTFAEGAVVKHPARRTVRALLSKARRVAGGLVQLDRRQRTSTEVAFSTLWAARPPLREFATVLRDRSAGSPYQRIQLCLVITAVRAAALWQRLLSHIGAEPPR